jgi:hypothetical protein
MYARSHRPTVKIDVWMAGCNRSWCQSFRLPAKVVRAYLTDRRLWLFTAFSAGVSRRVRCSECWEPLPPHKLAEVGRHFAGSLVSPDRVKITRWAATWEQGNPTRTRPGGLAFQCWGERQRPSEARSSRSPVSRPTRFRETILRVFTQFGFPPDFLASQAAPGPTFAPETYTRTSFFADTHGCLDLIIL